ncbi:MAG: Cellulose-binding protein [uncultured Thiotrichaceae bacterium]|uniref:Cellulose-binding protein n=1 Tax=uncultured Thiotrichaceae bacterium TaxID=298394 RepID=A0A6S6U5B7_9GAMM|nr:MAG: Cellulose-binding protein [uncultured Thiotrichaceae bacterium]
MITNRNTRLVAWVLPLFLSACGGEGNSANSNSPPPTPVSQTTTNTNPAGNTPTALPPPSVDNADFSLRRSTAIDSEVGQLTVNGTYSTKKLYYKDSQQEVSEFIIDNNEAIILKIMPDSSTDQYQFNAVYFSEDGSSQVSAEVTISIYADFQGQTAKVLPLGDSITHGYNSISYRYRLKQKTLDDSSVNIDFIGSQNRPSIFSDTQHDGFSGYRTDEILYGTGGTASLAIRLDNMSIPDMVLIHAGTNDMLQNYSVNHAVDHIRETIDVLRQRNPNITILLGQIVPTGNNDTNESIADLNDRLASLGSSMYTDYSPIILVNHYSDFYNSDLSDGIHPNQSGEEKMAERWFNAMLPLFDGYH